ncbi:MAG: hypothetical protein LBL13_01735 [Bacteroidales bacterium]|nr:hypothetical protein [Bacteroidales bacterium]
MKGETATSNRQQAAGRQATSKKTTGKRAKEMNGTNINRLSLIVFSRMQDRLVPCTLYLLSTRPIRPL